MAQEFGVFLVGIKIDYKETTGELVAKVVLQVETFLGSERIERQVGAVSITTLASLIASMLTTVAKGANVPLPSFVDPDPTYTPTHTGNVPLPAGALSEGIPAEQEQFAPNYLSYLLIN